MNPRQRILVVLLLGVIILGGGGFLVWSLMLKPLNDKAAAIAKLDAEVNERDLKMLQIQKNVRQLDSWKKRSLPADVDLARREYEKFLSELLVASEFTAGSFTVTPKPLETKGGPMLPNKQPIFTKVGFTVQGRGSLESLVGMMRRFYTTGFLHQIKNIQVQRPLTQTAQQRPRDLDITLNIEALVINGGDKRPFLIPTGRISATLDLISAKQRGVGGLMIAALTVAPGGVTSPTKLAPSARNYESVPAHNIFVGPPPVATVQEERPPDTDGLKYVYLTDVTIKTNPESALYRTQSQAFLYDRMANKSTQLQALKGYTSFMVGEPTKPTVKGEILRIDEREVFFMANDKYYSIQVGQNLADAMKSTLPSDKVKELGGTVTEAPKPATSAGPTLDALP